ncbi:MAG: TIGR02147 family protein [Myxococcota bacterium]
MPEAAERDLPTVFDYLDFRAFLADWFVAKKRVNPRFSHRVFARAAGQKSPSLLHHVIEGHRNLTGATAEAFAAAMKLGAAEATFFAHLVELGQATTDGERNEAWERIAATRRFRDARRIDGAGFEYLSSWFYPAIRELAYRPDFVDDAEWIARTLRPKITVARARRAVDALVGMGMLVADADGRLRPADASVVTPHEVAGLAVHNYHHGMLERAREAIAAFDPEERHFGGVTVAVPASLVQRLKQEVAAFQERVLNLCDTASEPRDRVYQLNLQLFPLTELRSPDDDR